MTRPVVYCTHSLLTRLRVSRRHSFSSLISVLQSHCSAPMHSSLKSPHRRCTSKSSDWEDSLTRRFGTEPDSNNSGRRHPPHRWRTPARQIRSRQRQSGVSSVRQDCCRPAALEKLCDRSASMQALRCSQLQQQLRSVIRPHSSISFVTSHSCRVLLRLSHHHRHRRRERNPASLLLLLIVLLLLSVTSIPAGSRSLPLSSFPLMTPPSSQLYRLCMCMPPPSPWNAAE